MARFSQCLFVVLFIFLSQWPLASTEEIATQSRTLSIGLENSRDRRSGIHPDKAERSLRQGRENCSGDHQCEGESDRDDGQAKNRRLGECPAGEFLSESGCVPLCSPHCVSCASQCLLCEPGFLLTPASNCQPCHSICEECIHQGNLCAQCSECHHFSKREIQAAVTCPEGCEKCTTSDTCEECRAGLQWNGETLQCAEKPKVCHRMCETCLDEETCLSCAPCHHFPEAGMTSGLCSSFCPLHCLECESDITCKECEAGFTLDSASFQCVENKVVCSPMCATCLDSETCLSCAPCYHFPEEGMTVGPCSSRCPTHCLECNSDISCQLCESGFYWDTDTTQCVATAEPDCDPSCETCSDRDTCLSCAPCFHFPEEGMTSGPCSSICLPNCLECNSDFSCQLCEEGYQWDQASLQCIETKINCHPMCASCLDTFDNCLECSECYHFPEDGMTSGPCSSLCPSHCFSCLSDSHCSMCDGNYTLTVDFLCEEKKCEPGLHCLECDQGGCRTCENDSYQTAAGDFNCTCIPGTHCKACGDAGCLECDSLAWTTVPGNFSCECVPGAHCQQCSDTGCVQCNSSFSPVPDSFDCAPITCDPGCASCFNATECATCKPNSIKIAAGFCEAAPGFYWNSTLALFAPCDPRCVECAGQADACTLHVCPDTCLDCDIADEGLCTSCKENAELQAGLSPGPCLCNPGFYFNKESKACAVCHQSCLACSDQTSCSICRAVSLLNGLACAAVCPTSFSSSQGVCTSRNAAVFQLTFNSLKPGFVDSIGGLKCVASTGMTVVFQQGLQFEATQKVDLPPNAEDSREIVLAPSFGVEMWLRPTDGGAETKALMTKTISGKTLFGLSLAGSTLSLALLSYTPGVPTDPAQQFYESEAAVQAQLSGGSIPSSRTWTYLRVTVETLLSASAVPSLELSLFLNGVKVKSSQLPSQFFRDFSSSEGSASFRIGGGFVGAVAEIVISAGTIAKSAAACSCQQCTAGGLCLSGCLGNEYLAAGSCAICPQQCPRGCLSTSCAPNLDPLCLSASDFSVCLQCKALARLAGTVCQCVANSQFQPTSERCECASGFKQSGEDCVTCLSYYRAKEVTMAVAATYTSFTVSFARNLDTRGLRTCGDMFMPETVAFFGSSPQCFVHGLAQIRVIFGDGFVPRSAVFSLLPSHVSSSEGSCSYAPEPLTLKFDIGLVPKPQAVITAPAVYSLACSSDPLLISAKSSQPGVPGPLQFKWTLSTDRGAFSIDNSNSNIVTIEKGRLLQGLLTVSLSVRDSVSEAVASTQVEIRAESAIAVEFDGGSKIAVPSSSKRKVTAVVAGGCGTATGKYLFAWTSLDSAAGAGVAAVLASQRGATITISALRPGTYSFLCSVSDSASNQGSAMLRVTVTSSELVIDCDRSGGVISQSSQLEVNCQNSYNPDDRNDSPAALWACESNSKPCLDASGAPLAYENSTLVLRVPGKTLQVQKSYIFTLTLTKDSRVKRVSMIFEVSEGTSIKCPANTKKMPNLRAANIHFEIDTKRNSDVTTAVVGGDANNMPFITLPAALIFDGGSFMITLDLNIEGAHISTKVEILVNSPPLPGSLSVTPSSGLALTTVFQLEVSQQFDTDGPDLPITNSFGYYTQAGQSVSMTVAQVTVSFATRLPSTAVKVFSRVCDSLSSCSLTTSLVSVSKPRALQSLSGVSLFDAIAQSDELVPTACIILAADTALSLSEWSYVFERTKNFAESLSEVDGESMLPLLSCYELLLAVKSQQSVDTLRKVTTTLETLVSELSGGSYEELLSRQLQAVQTYPLSKEAELDLLQEYVRKAAFALLNTAYPQQPAFEGSTSQFTVFARRMTATATSNATMTVGNCTVAVSPRFHTDLGLSDTDVMDLSINCYQLNTFPVGLATVAAAAAGSFQSLSWTPSSQRPLAVSTLSQPLTLTLPVYNASALSNSMQCLVWTEGLWRFDACKVMNTTPASVTVAVTRLGAITVVAKEVHINAAAPLPVFPGSEDCEASYIPCILLAGLIVAAAGSFLAVRARSVFSRKQLKGAQEQHSDPADLSLSGSPSPGKIYPSEADCSIEPPLCDPPDFSVISRVQSPSCEAPLHMTNVWGLQQECPREEEPKHTPEVQEVETLTPPPRKQTNRLHAFVEGHYLLGLVLQRKESHIACLAAVLLTQLTVLGVLYQQVVIDTSPQFVTRSEDALFFLWTVLCSQAASLLLTTVFILQRKAGRVVGLALAAVLSCAAFVVVPIMNSKVCGDVAARWSLCFLWTAAAEVLFGEALTAGYRFLLVARLGRS